MSEQTHTSDPRVLGRRTLERDHRHLTSMLKPGMSVLDIGCGTGAITAGIAKAVGPEGRAVGIDRDPALLDIARREHGAAANLQFEQGDALTLGYHRHFDLATAARVLQWMSEPGTALARMAAAVKTGGLVVVLDYNHEDNRWDPEPPAPFLCFYQAFLGWRASNGWNNRMAEALPALFESAGLSEVEVHVADERTDRGSDGWQQPALIWAHVVESLGPKMVAAGMLNESDLQNAAATYREWVETSMQSQVLVLRTVVGRV